MTYNIEAFGHQKLIFIPQHLKKVQMSGDKKMHNSESNSESRYVSYFTCTVLYLLVP